jgi:hypothetical protein
MVFAMSDLPTTHGTERFIVTPHSSSTEGETVLRVEVPRDLVFFEGHFEGNPMLPGVAQVLALVDREARRVFPDLASRGARKLSRLKFQATIRPGDTLELGLTLEDAKVEGEPQIRFRLDRVTPIAERASSGVLAYTGSLLAS